MSELKKPKPKLLSDLQDLDILKDKLQKEEEKFVSVKETETPWGRQFKVGETIEHLGKIKDIKVNKNGKIILQIVFKTKNKNTKEIWNLDTKNINRETDKSGKNIISAILKNNENDDEFILEDEDKSIIENKVIEDSNIAETKQLVLNEKKSSSNIKKEKVKEPLVSITLKDGEIRELGIGDLFRKDNKEYKIKSSRKTVKENTLLIQAENIDDPKEKLLEITPKDFKKIFDRSEITIPLIKGREDKLNKITQEEEKIKKEEEKREYEKKLKEKVLVTVTNEAGVPFPLRIENKFTFGNTTFEITGFEKDGTLRTQDINNPAAKTMHFKPERFIDTYNNKKIKLILTPEMEQKRREFLEEKKIREEQEVIQAKEKDLAEKIAQITVGRILLYEDKTAPKMSGHYKVAEIPNKDNDEKYKFVNEDKASNFSSFKLNKNQLIEIIPSGKITVLEEKIEEKENDLKENEVSPVELQPREELLKKFDSMGRNWTSVNKDTLKNENSETLSRLLKLVEEVDNLSYIEEKDTNGLKIWGPEYFQNIWPTSLRAIAEKIPFDTLVEWFREGKIQESNHIFTEKELSGEIGQTKLRINTLAEMCEEYKKEAKKTMFGLNNAEKYAKKYNIETQNTTLGKIIIHDFHKDIYGSSKKEIVNIIPEKMGFIGAKAKGYDTFIYFNPKNNVFKINSSHENLKEVGKILEKEFPGTVIWKNKIIFGPEEESARKNITLERLLDIIDKAILEKTKKETPVVEIEAKTAEPVTETNPVSVENKEAEKIAENVKQVLEMSEVEQGEIIAMWEKWLQNTKQPKLQELAKKTLFLLYEEAEKDSTKSLPNFRTKKSSPDAMLTDNEKELALEFKKYKEEKLKEIKKHTEDAKREIKKEEGKWFSKNKNIISHAKKAIEFWEKEEKILENNPLQAMAEEVQLEASSSAPDANKLKTLKNLQNYLGKQSK